MASSPPDVCAGFERELLFFVNGKKVVDRDVAPTTTLLRYLRQNLGLTGTKLGCAEGGCGACTVMVSGWSEVAQKVQHRSVNACLAPVLSMHGLAVTTVEGIGSTKTRLHPVQERIAKSHGSQCGFCTPGIVMSMYALLRNSPSPSLEQVEGAFDGNLCRCTGYRPILSGFKTLASGGGCCGGKGKDGQCCGGVAPAAADPPDALVRRALFDPAAFVPYDPTQEPIFPPALLLDKAPRSLYMSRQGPQGDAEAAWYTPTTLEEVLALKAAFPHAKMGGGHSELTIEVKFKKAVYPVWIAATKVPELLAIEESADGIAIGGAVPLTDVAAHLRGAVARLPAHAVHNYTAMLENLQWFAGEQIRNVATLAGNIVTASPISDLNPVFVACGAVVRLQSAEGGLREVPLCEFFLGYRKTAIAPTEVVVSVFVPFTREMEFTMAFKQARRKDDDIAVANACMRVLLAKEGEGEGARHTVKELYLGYGGVAPTTVRASGTEAALIGSTWDASIVDLACKELEADLPLSWDAPGGQVEFRRSLTTSFFFKFYLTVCKRFGVQGEPQAARASPPPGGKVPPSPSPQRPSAR